KNLPHPVLVCFPTHCVLGFGNQGEKSVNATSSDRGLTFCETRAADFKLEEGFTLLVGKDFTGWTVRKYSGKTDKPDDLDGKAEASGKRFVVTSDGFTIDPKVKGDMIIETKKMYAGDVTIRFQFKGDAECNNDLLFRGQKFDINVKSLKIKENEWHDFEISIKGENLEYHINKEVVKKGKVKADGTVFGIRAEFGGIEIKNLRVSGGK
ncbi:hypothetical protein DAPPUDRAFT_125702, partial [Daphnia pulex]